MHPRTPLWLEPLLDEGHLPVLVGWGLLVASESSQRSSQSIDRSAPVSSCKTCQTPFKPGVSPFQPSRSDRYLSFNSFSRVFHFLQHLPPQLLHLLSLPDLFLQPPNLRPLRVQLPRDAIARHYVKAHTHTTRSGSEHRTPETQHRDDTDYTHLVPKDGSSPQRPVGC